MKRLLAGLIIALLPLALPTTAHAASCSTTGAGGEKTPALFTGGTDLGVSAVGGYNCTKAGGWAAETQPMYESGGSFHYCHECAPNFHPFPPGALYVSGTGHNWTEPLWTPTDAADTPACSVNWLIQVNFFGSDGFVFQSTISPTLHKTC